MNDPIEEVDAELADIVATVADDYLVRRAQGENPDPAEYMAQFPQAAEQIRRVLGLLNWVDPSSRVQFQQSTFTPAAETSNYSSADSAPDRKGVSRLGDYVIRGEIGRGGMGEVLIADDLQLGRQVAIKVMRRRLADEPDARARFLREARAVAAIRHEHVVPIYHVGEDAGTPYLVMPLLSGETLAGRLERGPLSPEEVVRVGLEMAEGLAAAHERGIIHRDVKPANVWLDTPKDRVRLLDFGLARHANGSDGVTRPGVVIGTLAYMSPEQADGLVIDERADLFSLGAVLYQCATGQAPFSGKTLSATLRAVADYNPPPPHTMNPALPSALSDLVMKLLNKQPSGRPGSAKDVASVLAGMPAKAEPATQAVHSAKRWPRWPIAIAVALGGVALAAIFWPPRDRSPSTEITSTEPPPLDDRLVVRIWSPDKFKQGLQLGKDAGALPARSGDSVRAEVSLNQPAHIYLLILDAEGNVVPLYPWHRDAQKLEKTLADPPPMVAAESSLIWPSRESERGLELDDGSGQETILLLARRTPLPTEIRLADLVGKLPLSPTPLENLDTFVVRGGAAAQDEPALRIDQNRGFNTELKKIDDPLDRLITRLQPHFDLVRAVRFAHVAK